MTSPRVLDGPVGIVGAGYIGHLFAQQFAPAGHEVRAWSPGNSSGTLHDRLRQSVSTLVDLGAVEPLELDSLVQAYDDNDQRVAELTDKLYRIARQLDIDTQGETDDTREETRKVANLRRNPKIAFVIGGTTIGDERSVQYEGVADEPTGAELERLREEYFGTFPDGRDRQSWPGMTYVRARPTWIRYVDFNQGPPEIIEFDATQLGDLR